MSNKGNQISREEQKLGKKKGEMFLYVTVGFNMSKTLDCCKVVVKIILEEKFFLTLHFIPSSTSETFVGISRLYDPSKKSPSGLKATQD